MLPTIQADQVQKITWDNLPPSCKISKEMVFEDFRSNLRSLLLSETLLSSDNSKYPTTYNVSFHGGGDSGYIEHHHIDHIEPLQDFFDTVLNNFVTFDWFNNDGGGGEIEWDLINDTIKISGYIFHTVSEDQPEIEL